MFWPRDIWGRYAADLEDFKEATNRTSAIHCLNHMVTDALGLLPACITYMSQLKDPQVGWQQGGMGGGDICSLT
jgi:farnesyl-diphosphate farnesyltransferase